MFISDVYLHNDYEGNDSTTNIPNLLPLSIKILDKTVWNAVPSCRSPSWCSKDWMISKMCGSVQYRHGGLVTIDVISLAESINNMQLDVREGNQGDVDQSDQLVHPADVFSHNADTLPVFCHVLV